MKVKEGLRNQELIRSCEIKSRVLSNICLFSEIRVADITHVEATQEIGRNVPICSPHYTCGVSKALCGRGLSEALDSYDSKSHSDTGTLRGLTWRKLVSRA